MSRCAPGWGRRAGSAGVLVCVLPEAEHTSPDGDRRPTAAAVWLRILIFPTCDVPDPYPAWAGARVGRGWSQARPGLDQALAAVRTGDTLVVPELDRLARSVPDARDIGDSLAARGIRLSLSSTIYDPKTSSKRWA